MKNIVLDKVMGMAHQLAELEIASEKYQADTKKQIWVKMGDELESQNVPKPEIYSMLHRILEEELKKIRKDETFVLYRGGWYYDISKKNGWTKSYDSNTGDNSLSENNGIEKITGSFSKQREQFIQFHHDMIDQARANISLLESDIITEIKDGKETDVKLDWKKFFESEELWNKNFKVLADMFYADKDNWNKMRDSRQSLLPMMRLTLVALTSVATNKWVCSRFFGEVKNLVSITPKKMTQYMRDVKDVSDLFHSLNDDAWLFNFLDIPCPKCKEYRLKTKMFEDGSWVFICKNWEKHNKEEIFPSSIFTKEIKELSINMKNYSTNFLEKKGIQVPDN